MINQVVAFSGGKDSTALALLYPDAIPVFTDTKWEHQPLYDHIDKFELITGRKVERVVHPDWPGGLPQYIREYKFFPNHSARYCTRIFKIDAMNLWLQKSSLLPAEILIALRADEPADERVGNLSEIDGLMIRYPLREQGIDLWGVIKTCTEYGLLPRYPAYMARGGCKGCFYKRKAQVQAMIYTAPNDTNELQALEEEIQDQRGSYFYMFGNAGASIADLRQQPLLFSEEEVYQEIATDSLGVACGLFCRR